MPPEIGDKVRWPNGYYDRWGRPKGYLEGVVEELNAGVDGEALKVKTEKGYYYPHPNNVDKLDD